MEPFDSYPHGGRVLLGPPKQAVGLSGDSLVVPPPAAEVAPSIGDRRALLLDQDNGLDEDGGMNMVRLEDIFQLSVAERLDLLEKIWDSIVAAPGELPLTEAQCAELDRRLEAHARNPEDAETWDEVKARIRQRK